MSCGADGPLQTSEHPRVETVGRRQAEIQGVVGGTEVHEVDALDRHHVVHVVESGPGLRS